MSNDCLPIGLPDWAAAFDDPTLVIADEETRMRLAVDLARGNVEHGSGGPFGAAIFSLDDGHLIAIGVNSVMRLHSSVLHAEMMAILRAQRALGSYTLKQSGHALYTSCEPCAMCLGGVLWSGLNRLVCGAPAAAARTIGFDEGPVYPDSYRHLEQAGIAVRRGLLADEASAVIRLYSERGGAIYNG
ncbi:MAG: nucleoside deaminase [Gallionellaceae bacterium]|nr:nucleoside deaminase [Gallionellaceae bacterium]